MRDAVQYEKNINEFFMTIKAAILADDKTLKKVPTFRRLPSIEKSGRSLGLLKNVDHII